MNMNSAIVHPYDIELEHLNVADPPSFRLGGKKLISGDYAMKRRCIIAKTALLGPIGQ